MHEIIINVLIPVITALLPALVGLCIYLIKVEHMRNERAHMRLHLRCDEIEGRLEKERE